MSALVAGINGYRQWQKSLMADVELREIATAARKKGGVDIRLVAIAIAIYGANGRGCKPSAETM